MLNWSLSATPAWRTKEDERVLQQTTFTWFHALIWEKWNIKQHTQTCLLPSGSDFRLYSLFPLWTVTVGFCQPGTCTGLLSVARPGTSSCPKSHAHVEGLSLSAAFSLPPIFFFFFSSYTKLRLDSVFLNNFFSELSLFQSYLAFFCACVSNRVSRISLKGC